MRLFSSTRSVLPSPSMSLSYAFMEGPAVITTLPSSVRSPEENMSTLSILSFMESSPPTTERRLSLTLMSMLRRAPGASKSMSLIATSILFIISLASLNFWKSLLSSITGFTALRTSMLDMTMIIITTTLLIMSPFIFYRLCRFDYYLVLVRVVLLDHECECARPVEAARYVYVRVAKYELYGIHRLVEDDERVQEGSCLLYFGQLCVYHCTVRVRDWYYEFVAGHVLRQAQRE